jgi:hypothetical protein
LEKRPKRSGSQSKVAAQPVNDDVRVALWLGLALFFLYLLTTPAHQPYGDEEKYLAVAENILTRGSPAITSRADGQLHEVISYSKFALGQSLLILPFVAAALLARETLSPTLAFIPQMLTGAFPALESAAVCSLLFLLIRLLARFGSDLALSLRVAVVVAGVTGVATQIWPSSHTYYADNSTAFLLTFTTYALVRFRLTDAGPGWLVAAAWVAALMVLCKNLFFLACPAFVAYGCWAAMERQKKGKPITNRKLIYLIVMIALPFFLVATLQLWYNDLRYGSVWLSGYHQTRDERFGFATPLLVGLYGIFFSAGRSLFLYSPPCILGFAGLSRFLKRAPAETSLIAGASLPVVLAYAKWWSWHGGWEWGTRFYLFLLPLLMLLSMPAWCWIDQPLSIVWRRIRQTMLALLIVASLGVQTLGLLIHPAAYWVLTARELHVLRRPVYQTGVWEIRDDMPLAHFVPEFSPLAAHVWMVWATMNRHRLDDTELATSAPWYSLNPEWRPQNVRPYLGFDVWFVADAPETGLGKDIPLGYVVITVAALVAMVVLCVLKLWPLIAKSSRPSP